MLTDMDYLHLLQNGDKQGLEFFYNKHYPFLYYYALKMIGNREEAQDNASEALVKLWEHRQNIQSIASVKPFLFTIVKNLCLNYLRRKKVEKRSIKNQPLPEPEYFTWINNENRAEIMEMLNAAIDKLTARQREIFELMNKGLSNREIAEQLNIEKQTVRSQKYNIHQWARELLQSYLSEEP